MQTTPAEHERYFTHIINYHFHVCIYGPGVEREDETAASTKEAHAFLAPSEGDLSQIVINEAHIVGTFLFIFWKLGVFWRKSLVRWAADW